MCCPSILSEHMSLNHLMHPFHFPRNLDFLYFLVSTCLFMLRLFSVRHFAELYTTHTSLMAKHIFFSFMVIKCQTQLRNIQVELKVKTKRISRQLQYQVIDTHFRRSIILFNCSTNINIINKHLRIKICC